MWSLPAELLARFLQTYFVSELRGVLAERNFRRLFATRLISQAGDGMFTAGLGSYVFFNNTTFPNPASAASAFAVLYLPYSLIGPFAGVFIDRWSRRQILVWSALARSAFVALTAVLVGSGSLGVPVYVGVLAVLGANRFFLSSLSAALPHVVPEDKLVIANSVSPTAGGIIGAIGGIVGLGVHIATGGGRGGSAATLLVAGCCYIIASLVAATMRRDTLGPHTAPGEQRPGRVLDELAIVTAGLVAAVRYIRPRRGPVAALGAVGASRFLYGILFLMSILVYRNYFYRALSANDALRHFTVLVGISAVGYGCAALLTPQVTKVVSKPACIALMLVASAVVAGAAGETFHQAGFLIIGFVVNLASQGVAICATTIIQEQVDDGYRGRVFSFYDMMFNATFVAGAGLSAVFMPVTGKSQAIIALVAAGYAVAAGGYWLAGRQSSPGGASGTSSPSAAAQRSSS